MVVKRVHLKDKNIKKIYEDSFIQKEKMPFKLMVFLSTILPNTKFKKFIENNKEVGFIYYSIGITQVFLMFFAVDQNIRSQGYGSKIMTYIKNKYPRKCIVTSIGDLSGPEKETILRRKSFYLKNGFKETEWKIKLMKLYEYVLTANKNFSKNKFRIFIILYSLFFMWPKIKKINNK